MNRLFDDSGLRKRSNISLAVLVAVSIYGLWELWHAFQAPVLDSTAALFGVAFVAGAAYGLRMTMTEARDLIAALDADEASGEAIITLWRPFRSQKIATRLDRFSDWRHYVRIGSRGERRHYLTARSADYPRQLMFELAMAKPVPQGLARLAPEAAKDFERATRQSR